LLAEGHRSMLDMLVAAFLGVPEQIDNSDFCAAQPHQPQGVMSCLDDLVIMIVSLAPGSDYRVIALDCNHGRPDAMRAMAGQLFLVAAEPTGYSREMIATAG
jgi:hypothetical protein